MRQQKVKENILRILEEKPHTRNSDKALMLTYWQEVDMLSLNQSFFYLFEQLATPPESITRARRQIQSQGLFPPTDENVFRQRMKAQEDFHEYYSNTTLQN